MEPTSKVSEILITLKTIDNEFLMNLSKSELKELRATISTKEMIVSRMYKRRIQGSTHFKPESK